MMQEIEDFVDEGQKMWCIHCARTLADLDTSKDHVPSKSLITKPYPHQLPVVIICRECNNGFSFDEQYAVTFLSCVLVGCTAPEKRLNASAARALTKHPRLRARIEQSQEDITRNGKSRIIWKPEMHRIERIVLKNARGHAYFEYGEPMLEAPIHVRTLPLENMTLTERENFERLNNEEGYELWPEIGSRMMTRLVNAADMSGRWVIVQEGVYRYSVQQTGGIRVQSIIFEYLATEVLWGD